VTEIKWFNDLKEKYEQTIQQATKDYLRGIYLYLQEKLEGEEFEFLKDYAERHGRNFHNSSDLKDYKEIEMILDFLSENLQGLISPPLTQAETLLAESILGKLGYKQCWNCKKWFEPKDKENFCPECKK